MITCLSYFWSGFWRLIAPQEIRGYRLHSLSKLNICTAWKVSKYGVFSDPYLLVFGLNTENCEGNLRIHSEFRKIQTRENSIFGHFSQSTAQEVQTFVCSLLIWDDCNYSFETTVTRNLSVIIKLELDLLRKKCPYLDLFWSTFFLRFLAFGLDTERYGLPLRIQSESGKMWVKCGPE